MQLRKKLVQTAFTDEDLAEVTAAAKRMGVHVATFVRIAALKAAREVHA